MYNHCRVYFFFPKKHLIFDKVYIKSTYALSCLTLAFPLYPSTLIIFSYGFVPVECGEILPLPPTHPAAVLTRVGPSRQTVILLSLLSIFCFCL